MSRCKRLALLAVLIAPSSARGQAGLQPSSCTYARCALHVETVHSQLVQGIEGKPVETSGWYRPRIPLLESSPDSVRIPYEEFRTHAAATHGIFAAGLGVSILEAIMIAQDARHRSLRPAKMLAGMGLDLGVGIAGLVEAKRSADALQTAMA